MQNALYNMYRVLSFFSLCLFDIFAECRAAVAIFVTIRYNKVIQVTGTLRSTDKSTDTSPHIEPIKRKSCTYISIYIIYFRLKVLCCHIFGNILKHSALDENIMSHTKC